MTKKAKMNAAALGACCAFLVIPSAYAEDLVVIPSIAFLGKNLSFSQTNIAGTTVLDTDFSGLLPMLDTSLTMGYNKWYMSFKYDKTFTEVSMDTDEEPLVTSSGNERYFWQPPGTEMKVEREDKNITIGYNVMEGLNIFVGYMEGETTITPPPTCENPVIYTPAPPVTQIFCQSYNFAWLRQRDHNTYTPTAPLGDYVQTYTEEGPYVGFSYAWVMGDAGVLSLSLAYAEMDGNFTDSSGGPVINGFDAEGDVSGTSVGVTWTQPLSERTAYFIDVRQQDYDMDSEDKTTGYRFDTSETMLGITTGMQFYF